jgi:hypothetical protein
MKKLLMVLFLLISSLGMYSQTKIDYPIFSKDSSGQAIVVMTVDQAQKLDNMTDLISLLKKMDGEVGGLDSACIKVVNEQQQIIATQKLQISDIKSELSTKNQEISNLQLQILNYQKDVADCNRQNKDQSQIVSDQAKTIHRQKLKMIFGGGLEGLAIIGLVLLLIHH